MAFESVDWQSSDVPAFYVINTLIGNATSFSSGGPGKGMYCRAITNLMQKNNFVESAGAINSHYSDSGLFGMSITGPDESSADLMKVLLAELAKLKTRIPDEELERAKNILKINILMALERKEDRVEEIARNYMTYGQMTFQNYCEKIDQVTSNDINRAAAKALLNKPTLLVSAKEIDNLPLPSDVHSFLN